MKEIIKEMILNFHAEPLPELIPREVDFVELPEGIRKAITLIGMRRSGKTWALYQRMRQLMAKGLDKTQIIYINFEDERLSNFNSTHFQEILDAFHELYPQHINSPDVHFFFDEIQEVEDWEKFIRRLIENEKYQILITGSSAKMLSKEIATSLRGRTFTREVFPLSIEEYLQHKSIEHKGDLNSKQKARVLHALETYIEFGGFPEAVALESSPNLHRELLQSYIDVVIYRDIVERHNVTNVTALKQLAYLCLKNAASHLSINKTFNTFKSMGISVSRSALYDYMDYFEDAYCLFSVPLYTFSEAKAARNPKKIYPVDPGLMTAYSIKPDFDKAARFEITVFTHLRRRIQEIAYYFTQNELEVDFVAKDPRGVITLIQACYDMSDEQTREREVKALSTAMQELEQSEGYIITLSYKEELDVPAGKIHCVPLWELSQLIALRI